MWQYMKFDTPDGSFEGSTFRFTMSNSFDWGRRWGSSLNVYRELPNQNMNIKMLTEASLMAAVHKSFFKNKPRVNLESTVYSLPRDGITRTHNLSRRFFWPTSLPETSTVTCAPK